ncbi:uncharacterized protein LOC132563899 [Ylistrum balloti]|uniref:uncharacterized protein LOC132563899 n=1 Tax=Ylistrum balloti TaxID=509963 RepID=UPI002905AA6C|nr:uncharacterized protein LOC132563899 [Ylistrum balloti]
MAGLKSIIFVAFLPHLNVVLGYTDNPLSGDCVDSEGPKFSPGPQWPQGPHLTGGVSMLKFSCTVENSATSSFNMTWTKDEEILNPSDHVYFENSNQILEIWPPLVTSDGGMYACTVIDSNGNSCTYKGYAIVIPSNPTGAPNIVATSPINKVQVVSLGDSIQISCTMTVGSTSLFLHRWWNHNGTKLNDSPHLTFHTLPIGKDREALFLNITNVTSEDLGEYTCVANNSYGTDNQTITLQEYQPAPGKVLPTWQIAVIGGGGFLAITVLVAAIVIRVKHRHNQIDWPPLDPENYDVPGYALEYDVFISYSSEDEEWVKNELFKQLLSMGYNVNIDFKDFIPGMAVAENVLDSIYKSRKTIVLMSRNFLKSMWGQFELQQAHNKAIAQRKDVLILIKFDKCKVPAKLMGKTFLDWTDVDIRPHFWQRLQDAIGDPVNYAEINQRPAADQPPVAADQLPVAVDQLPVVGEQLPVRNQDKKNTDEVNMDNENQKNLRKKEDKVHMRPKKTKKKQKMEDHGQMIADDMEGLRISQEEKMQLIA